jgi:hypothetical protein
MTFIDDGTGKGFKAKVNSRNEMLTRSFSESLSDLASLNGDGYNANTGTINLTSGSSSACFYLRNDSSTRIMIVPTLIYLLGNSTGGSGDILVEVLNQPVTGTIIDNASPGSLINRNLNSTKSADATFYAGAEGDTFTTGTVSIQSIINSVGRSVINVGALVLGEEAAIGVRVTPQSGNTSMDVQIAAQVYYRPEED